MRKKRSKQDIASEFSSDIRRISCILETDIFEESNKYHPLLPSAITELMICLNDLLRECKDAGTNIVFTDDGHTEDVTKLVKDIRDAVCHTPSETHRLSQSATRFTFNTAYGKMKFDTGSEIITSDYEDDVCFFFGNLKIYLKRHIIRAFREAEKILSKRPFEKLG